MVQRHCEITILSPILTYFKNWTQNDDVTMKRALHVAHFPISHTLTAPNCIHLFCILQHRYWMMCIYIFEFVYLFGCCFVAFISTVSFRLLTFSLINFSRCFDTFTEWILKLPLIGRRQFGCSGECVIFMCLVVVVVDSRSMYLNLCVLKWILSLSASVGYLCRGVFFFAYWAHGKRMVQQLV